MKIVEIGTGFVGKAAGKGFLSKGHNVAFVDVNTQLIESLKSEGLDACFSGSTCANDGDIYLVSVLTPTIDDKLDLRFIKSALANLGTVLKTSTHWPIVVIRSTVPPGTTENVFLPILEKYSEKQAGKDFGIAMNPEFLREVSAEQDFLHPWIVVVGSRDFRVAKVLDDLYQPFGAPIHHLTIKEAEMLKYVHNIFNAAKISFFNEMRSVAKAAGVDADKVFQVVSESAEASWNRLYGTRDFGPFSGSCLPKDSLAFLNWVNETLGLKMPLLHSIIGVNERLKDRAYLGF